MIKPVRRSGLDDSAAISTCWVTGTNGRSLFERAVIGNIGVEVAIDTIGNQHRCNHVETVAMQTAQGQRMEDRVLISDEIDCLVKESIV